jgi:hypothetical protein
MHLLFLAMFDEPAATSNASARLRPAFDCHSRCGRSPWT